MSWQRVDGLAWTDPGEDGVIQVATYPATQVYTLVRGAALIWLFLDEPIARDELVDDVADYAGLPPEEVADDIDQCLSQLADVGLTENR